MIKKVLQFIKLQDELDDFDAINTSIENGVVFKGTNLWILVFAIIVASVGLNMNSTAVIIGAMLISPLMGPINGIGYSIATYNFPLLRKSVKNFTFAIGASLVASTFYFALSPISTAHSELLARTSPTIYDVLIALFGGLAGIVAISSKKKGNVIPGVAIATALMPPLCTAGYGLATGQFLYFFGALYLFTINSVFIAISSLIISQLLKFPIRSIIDSKKKTIINRWLYIVISITIIPSIYFGYGLVQENKFIENATNFTTNVSVFEGKFLLQNNIDPHNRQITLVYGGTNLTEEQKLNIQEKSKDFSLENASVVIKQGLSFNNKEKEDATSLETQILREEVARQSTIIKSQNSSLDSIKSWPNIALQIQKEASTLFPYILTCAYSKSQIPIDTIGTFKEYSLVVFRVNDSEFKIEDKPIVKQWLQSRLQSKDVKVFYEYIEF